MKEISWDLNGKACFSWSKVDVIKLHELFCTPSITGPICNSITGYNLLVTVSAVTGSDITVSVLRSARRISDNFVNITVSFFSNSALTSFCPRDNVDTVSCPNDNIGIVSCPSDNVGTVSCPNYNVGIVSCPRDNVGTVSCPLSITGGENGPLPVSCVPGLPNGCLLLVFLLPLGFFLPGIKLYSIKCNFFYCKKTIGIHRDIKI